MGTLLNRRRYMGGGGEEPLPPHGQLLYYWDSSDDLIDGCWVDRIQGCAYTAKDALKENGMWYCNGTATGNNGRYFSNADMNSGDNKIVLPKAWIAEIVFKTYSSNTKPFMIADFGAHGYSSHAWGVTCQPDGTIGVNYKPNGNNSNYGLSESIQIDVTKTQRIVLGTQTQTNGVLLFLTANGVTKYGKAAYNGSGYDGNWYMKYGYFGRGHSSSTLQYTTGNGWIKSIKLYEGEQI